MVSQELILSLGRPRIHGDKFKLNDSETWWAANQFVEVLDPKLGLLRLQLWRNLHFQQSAKIKMDLIQVQRLNQNAVNQFKPLWLGWVGIDIPELSDFWRLYLQRFAVDHWYRFALATFALDCSETKYLTTVSLIGEKGKGSG